MKSIKKLNQENKVIVLLKVNQAYHAFNSNDTQQLVNHFRQLPDDLEKIATDLYGIQLLYGLSNFIN